MAVQVRILTTDETPPSLLAEVHQLLVDGFAGDFSDEDWEHTQGGRHVIAFDADAAVSHAAVVPRTIRVADHPYQAGYVEGVATAPGRRREGLASLVMAEASSLVQGEFELGVLSTDLHSFYERFGWERWRGTTFVDHGDRLVRTPEEDDGIMVLRSGPSTAVDLREPISCRRRSGDDW